MRSPTLAERLACDGAAALGVAAFHDATGRRAARRWEEDRNRSFLDPATGRVRADLAFEHAACPFCAGALAPWIVADGYPYLRCADCGGSAVSPGLSAAAILTEVYGEQPYPFFTPVNTATQVGFDAHRYDLALKLLAEVGAGPRLLDVGCGSGVFLERAAARGYQATGCDPLRLAREAASARGLAVTSHDAETVPLDPQGYDVLACWEVLDMLPHPARALRRLAGALRPGGWVVLYVRNAESLAVRILRERCHVFLGYAHPVLWTARAIQRVAAACGLEVAVCTTLVSEVGPVQNHLAFADPYGGRAAPVLPALTAEEILRSELGYKLLAFLRAP